MGLWFSRGLWCKCCLRFLRLGFWFLVGLWFSRGLWCKCCLGSCNLVFDFESIQHHSTLENGSWWVLASRKWKTWIYPDETVLCVSCTGFMMFYFCRCFAGLWFCSAVFLAFELFVKPNYKIKRSTYRILVQFHLRCVLHYFVETWFSSAIFLASGWFGF